MQWGIGGGSSKVTFPIAFTTGMYVASAGLWGRDADSVDIDLPRRITWYTPTLTTIDFVNDEVSSYRKTYWLALGK